MADRDTLPPDAPDAAAVVSEQVGALAAARAALTDTPAQTLRVEGLRARALLGERAHAFARALAPLVDLGPFVLVLAETDEDDGAGLAICTQTNVTRDAFAATMLRAAHTSVLRGDQDV